MRRFDKIFYLISILSIKNGNFLRTVAFSTVAAANEQNDTIDLSKHPCRRTCREGQSMTCYYNFEVTQFSTIGNACYECPKVIEDCFDPSCIAADGIPKAVIVVNRQLPGPLIEVCEGDKVVVDVVNHLSADTTSVHWHGLRQRGTQYMDGVPYITQCPILPGRTFRYEFFADDSGTNFWHSHTFEQKADGMFGGLIVRTPKKNYLYDVDEHVVIINEWTELSGADSYALQVHGRLYVEVDNILVNGRGRSPKGPANVPITIFEVEQGKKYRFRIINSGSQDCPMRITFDKHDMYVISSDGNDIEPIKVRSIRTLSGERYDVVIDANQNISNYWILFKGVDVDACENRKILQQALLRYKGAPEVEPSEVLTYDSFLKDEDINVLNPYNEGLSTSNLCITNQNSLQPDDKTTIHDPDYQFFISYNSVEIYNEKLKNNMIRNGAYRELPGDNVLTFFRLNDINFELPTVPLLTQYDMVDPKIFCNSSTVSDCFSKYCKCTHTMEVKLNSIVELVIVDGGDVRVNHPMHLHGYKFRVVGMEILNGTVTVDRIKQLDKAGKIQRKLKYAPLKDTVMVPSNGFTIIRFYADNPGFWLFHCHFERHAHVGMELLFKVGDESDFTAIPKDFPRC